MKLYTEEQVNRALELLVETGKHNSKIIEQLTPIELPSDEDIIKRAKENPDDLEITESHRIGYIAGAKWMKEQILTQIK